MNIKWQQKSVLCSKCPTCKEEYVGKTRIGELRPTERARIWEVEKYLQTCSAVKAISQYSHLSVKNKWQIFDHNTSSIS